MKGMPGKKLLVADDSLTIQKVIRLALSNEGYEIHTVPDGPEAIQRIFLSRPDLVLIDVSLPGKSGFEVKREINQHEDLEEVRFVLMSSAFEKVDESQIEEVGFHGRLTKPFDPAHLRTVLTEALAQVTAKRNEKTTMLQRPSGSPPLPGKSGPPPMPSSVGMSPPKGPPLMPSKHAGPPPRPPSLPPLPGSAPPSFSPPQLSPELGSDSNGTLPPELPNLSTRPPLPPSLALSGVPSGPPSFPSEFPSGPSAFPPMEAPAFLPPTLPSEEGVSTPTAFGADWTENSGAISMPLPNLDFQTSAPVPPFDPGSGLQDFPGIPGSASEHHDSDIKSLTESTIQISGLEEYEWSIGEPNSKKHAAGPDVVLPPFSQDQIEALVKKQVQAVLQEMTQKLLPDLAEKMIKQEIHKMLMERQS